MALATTEPTLTEHEAAQVERANASKATPVVFVHGLWLLPSSWDRWVTLFEEAGYVALTPGWPDYPETVYEARAHPVAFEAFARSTCAASCSVMVGSVVAMAIGSSSSLVTKGRYGSRR